ncbi:O-acyltransferase like protein-like [Uloborus diversus]|uniref:O-acyltransferase like protein-like n=1 Tax=Uloborus diversus TaxID=327109 RepID=UPI002409F27E|nr:O-acyltransferase like protein-like [Uloborus diversus]
MGISIEAYFLFSGILLAYPRFRRQEKKVNIRIIKLIVRRYIRLCPSLLLILGIIVALPLLGSGPVYADIFEAAADNTRKWWWTYALMFNNFLPVKDQNFLYLWFIPCLMQITIVGALFLWLIAKFPKFGIFVTIAAGIICNVIVGVQTALKHFPPTYSIYYYHDREYFEEPIYTAPLNHVLTYGIGMILGYYMAKNPVLKWSKKHVVFGWIVSLLLTVGVQLVCYVWHEGLQPDPVAAAIYAATHRTAFTLGLAWIILACTHGYGGAFAKILSWKGFVPLSKLGYFGYLIHYIVITHHVSMARVPLMYSHYEVWMRFCGYSFLTFLSAFVLYITFEQPLVSIESLFWPRRPDDSASQIHLPRNIKVSDLVVVKHSDNEAENSMRPSSNGSSLSRREATDEHSRL